MELASILNVNLVYVSHFQLLHQPATAVLNLGTADVLLVQQLGLFLSTSLTEDSAGRNDDSLRSRSIRSTNASSMSCKKSDILLMAQVFRLLS